MSNRATVGCVPHGGYSSERLPSFHRRTALVLVNKSTDPLLDNEHLYPLVYYLDYHDHKNIKINDIIRKLNKINVKTK